MKKFLFPLLVLIVIVIGLLHFFTPGHDVFFHDTYRRLSYFPIVLGAIWFGVWYEGLYRYDRAGWYNLEREGTGTTNIHRLYRTTGGALWVLTDNGIVQLVGDPFALD